MHLPAAARSRPYALAVVCPPGRSNFRPRLYSFHLSTTRRRERSHRPRTDRHRRPPRDADCARWCPPSLEFFALTFALFKLGAVLVLIDPGMGIRHLGRCLGEGEPEAFIGVRKAHVARKLLGWAKKSVRITVGVGSRLFCQQTLDEIKNPSPRPSPKRGGERLSDLSPPRFGEGSGEGFFTSPPVTADETAAILFTSGSTGVAKGAVYTHGIFAAQVEALRRLYDIEPGEIDLPTFPLFALFAPALGMTAIIPDMDPTRPGPRRSAEHRRGDRGFGRDQPVRLAGPAQRRRALGRRAQRQAAVAAAGDLGRCSGAGGGDRADDPDARLRCRSVHALRGDRMPAGGLDRQPAKSSARRAHAPTSGPASASAGRCRRSKSPSSRSAMSRSRFGTTIAAAAAESDRRDHGARGRS